MSSSRTRKAEVIRELEKVPETHRSELITGLNANADAIIESSNELEPVFEFLKRNPRTAYYATDGRLDAMSESMVVKIFKENPNLSSEQLMRRMLPLLNEAILAFARENGYPK
jgi:hypothetical protein